MADRRPSVRRGGSVELRRWLVASASVAALLTPLACGDPDTATTSTTSPASTTMGTEPTTTTRPTSLEEALAGFAYGEDIRYAGDCAATTLEADVNAWCSTLHEDRGATRIYAVGPTFSEYTAWLLVVEGPEGWAVEDTAAMDAVMGDQSEPEQPPW